MKSDRYKYYSMSMHLHSCYQPGGSMESHIYNASLLGMKYIRFTDHDVRLGTLKSKVCGFDFTQGELVSRSDDSSEVGWKLIGDPEIGFNSNGVTLTNHGHVASIEGIEFYSSGKRHSVSMLSEVTLKIVLSFELTEGASAVVDIRMSQRPPDHKPAHLCYYAGKEPSAAPHTAYLPLPKGENGVYTLSLSEDLRQLGEIGGLDNALDSILLTTQCQEGDKAVLNVRELSIQNVYQFNDVLERQRKLADEIGARYGIKPFVTFEISGAGQHKNCFSTKVPAIDYRECGYSVSERDAIGHVKNYGGIFSYNHPFENRKYKYNKMSLSPQEKEREIEREAANLVACKVLGATLMEVGFVEKRGAFTLGDHLKLWDTLSLSGVFITGYGDSDSHSSSEGWFKNNNFASWIAAPEDEGFPVSEESFIDSMKAGRLYMGDPVYLKDSIEFTADGCEMGSVFYDTFIHKFTFKAKNIKKGYRVRIITNGDCQSEYLQDNDGDVTLEWEMSCEHDRSVAFSRVEMYNDQSRCIMLTNPIYLANPDRITFDIPTERIAPSFLPEATKEYGENIVIPEVVRDIKGKRILHIGDTEARCYPFLKKLIGKLKPDIIIHTGDLADEVKVGRIPGTKNEYISKIKVLLEILRQSSADIIIVPGNNDLENDIKMLLPTAMVVPVNSVVDIDGVECRVGHQVHKMTFDKKWHFYGHGLTGETWEYKMNLTSDIRRFNAVLGCFVCSVKEDIFSIINIPK